MRISRNLLFRLSLFFILLILLTPPFNNWIKLFILSLISVAIFTAKVDEKIFKKKLFPVLLILIIFVKFYAENYSLIVNHIVLPTKSTNKFNYIKNNFDKELYLILEEELNKLGEKEVLLNNIRQPSESDRSTKYKKFAFQSENIWTSLDEGKYIFIKKNLNFWDLGPSALNDTDLNFGDTKSPNYQTNLKFPVLFKINFKKINDKSNLCFKGNLIIKEKNNYLKKFSKKITCLKIDYNKNYFFLDYNRDLQLNIKNNIFYDNLNILFFISLILFLITVLKLYKEKNYFYFFITISFYIVLFLYFKFGLNPISGYSETIYFDRGMDGMAHYGYARVILNNLFLGDIYNGLKGTENIFYYMPLTRYINSIFMIFFGENILGIIFLISFFPILIFKTLNIYLDSKNSKIFTIIFLFFPIFESLGFTIINYISYTVDGYGEGLAYLLLLFITYLFLKNDEYNFKYFLIGFCSFIIIGIRPNYLIFCISLILGNLFYLYFKRKIISKYILKVSLMSLGFLFILLIPIHNYIYGNDIVLIVKSENVQNSYHVKINDYLLLLKDFLQIEINTEILNKITNHLNHYIKIYEFWFLIVLFNLFFVLFKNYEMKIKILTFSSLLMHSTYLLFLGDPRYSMGCWLVSFFIFIFTFKTNYYPWFYYLKAKFFQRNNILE